jgi:hypothetical protein
VRFVLAIVAFIVAAAMIGLGIAQRTVLAPAGNLSASATLHGDVPFAVIDGKVLNAHPNQQTLRVSGSRKIFVAYGRTADVKAWLGDEPYANLSHDASTNTLSSHIVRHESKTDAGTSGTGKSGTGDTGTASPAPTSTASPAPTASSAPTATPGATTGSTSSTGSRTTGPNPAGSDLWLEEYTGTDASLTRMNIPNDVSVIIASDGTKPAPDTIRIAWPASTATPWAGPLITGGMILLLVGIVLLILGLRGLRRSRGPRRSGPKMPKLPKSPRYKPSKAMVPSNRGRRVTRGRRRMVAASTVVLGALALGGCSADYWPQFPAASTPTPTPTVLNTDAATLGKDVVPPAVTVPQLQKIVAKIATLAAHADADLSSDELTARFAGPALKLRSATYAIRTVNGNLVDPPAAIPAGPLEVSLPQATRTWPRVVETVVQSAADKTKAPIMLVLVQQTPRENYKVNYAMQLQANVTVPDLAPASIGTSIVPPDSKFLLLPPGDLAKAYEDILANGSASKYAPLFDLKGDTLEPEVSKLDAAAKANLASTASLDIQMKTGPGPVVALATNNSGAIVTVDVNEVQTFRATAAQAEVNPGAVAAALSGKATSKTGYTMTFDYQLLFYVPPAESKKKIALLGFNQGLTSATEIP